MNHFGLKVLEGQYGLKLTRENYAVISNKSSLPRFSADIYTDAESVIYSDAWCSKQLEDSLKNYDLNMKYFSLLDRNDFNTEIESFLNRNKSFVEVKDLSLYDQKSGYYIMVLDEYCQVYIGTTENIKQRVRQHWNKRKPFDRLLFPMGNVEGSILSVDSFRPLDTTRIFVLVTQDIYTSENEYINEFSPCFVCNRMEGGRVTGGLIQAISMIKNRKL